jgi:hypothetical protein
MGEGNHSGSVNVSASSSKEIEQRLQVEEVNLNVPLVLWAIVNGIAIGTGIVGVADGFTLKILHIAAASLSTVGGFAVAMWCDSRLRVSRVSEKIRSEYNKSRAV